MNNNINNTDFSMGLKQWGASCVVNAVKAEYQPGQQQQRVNGASKLHTNTAW